MERASVSYALCVVTDRAAAGGRDLLEVIQAAIVGGATMVQLREKHASAREVLALGQALHALTRAAGIPLIVNDRVDLALALGAEGVHLGQDDLPAAMARQLLGPHVLIGVSADTAALAQQAVADGADYLGVGDVFGTPSKPDAGVPIGPAGLAAVAQSVDLPILAIGGISAANAPAALAAGAHGLAVISAVIAAPDPRAAATRLRQLAEPGWLPGA